MILEQLDIVLIVGGGILIAVSFIMNILGTKKINHFSEEINRLELLLSERTVEKKEPSSSRHVPGSSHDSAYDSSILPAAEIRTPDGKRKTRYRAPGLHIDKLGNIVSGAETAAPDDSAVKSKPVEPAPEPERPEISGEHDTPVQAFSAKPQKTPIPLKKTAETPDPQTPKPLKETAETVDLPEEEKALLKSYLNGPSDVLEETGDHPKSGSRDSRPAKEEESEVMEVIEDNQFSSVNRIQNYGLKPVEINPFDNTVQKIDFEKIYQTLSGMKTGENLILNFRDILFLIESEYQSLKQLYTKASNKNIILSIKNVTHELKNDILSRISRINFIP